MPQKFETAEGDVRLNAVVVDVDEKSGKAKNITRMTQSV
jgi:calcineurin-like phosphoesterase